MGNELQGQYMDEDKCPVHRVVGGDDRQQAEEALKEELRTLKHLLQSSDHERQLIAYEIHDGLAQQLAGVLMQFQTYEHLKDTQPEEAANAYRAGMIMLQQSHSEARRLVAGVGLPLLDDSGVVEAIANLVHERCRSTGQKIDLYSRVDFDRLAPALENAIYRITQEAVTNACKHSKSERVRVSLLQQQDRVRITIRDWGVGFDRKTMPENRFGLEGIRQRARLLGGKCSIRSAAGKGACVTVDLPVVARESGNVL
jgi:two-component system sensor histidine kinase DegS